MRYAVVIEKGERNYSAYVPDLPGCVSVGDSAEQVKSEIREAIVFHIEGMLEDVLPIPYSVEPGGLCRGWRAGCLRTRDVESPNEGLCRRSLPRMRQLHHGAQRHLPQVRHLRRHDGVQLKSLMRGARAPSWPGLTRPSTF